MKKLELSICMLVLLLLFSAINSKAQWTQVSNGIYGGEVYDVVSLGSNLFAAVNGSGVYVSTNYGANWQPANNGLTNPYVYKFGISGSTLFAGGYPGLFRSTNNGTLWQDIASGTPLNGLLIWDFCTVGSNIFLTAYGAGVFLSTNNGTNWQAVNNGLPLTPYPSLANNSTYLFAGTYGSGVYRTSNNGANWQAVNSGLTDLNVSALIILNNYVFAGTSDNRVFRSSNNGDNWIQTGNGLNDNRIYSLGVKDTLLFAGGSETGVYRSSDYGNNWVQVSSGITFNYVGPGVESILANGSNLFIGTLHGVYSSTNNGNNWSFVNNGITGVRITSFVSSGINLFAGTVWDGVYLSANYGQSWTKKSTGMTDNKHINAMTVKGSYIFASGGYFGITYRSSNNGDSWLQLSTNNYPALASNSSNVFGGTQGLGVFTSTNNGDNWITVNNGLTSLNVYSLGCNGSTTFAGSQDSGIYRSTNNGASWQHVKLTGDIRSFTFAGSNSYAGTEGSGAFRSTDDGLTWISIGTGIPHPHVYSLAGSGTYLFGGTGGAGAYVSTNYGANWTTFNDGFLTANSSPWPLIAMGDFLFASQYGNGIYRRTILIAPTLISPVNNSINQPLTLSLAWNSVPSAIGYKLQVAADSNFTTTVINDSTLTNTTYNVLTGALQYNTKYYWKVCARSGGGLGPWSVKWNFTTVISPPAAPTLIAPPNGAINITITPTLDWNDVPTAVNYRIRVSTDSSFVTSIINDSNLTVSQYTIPNGFLSNNTKYYWRVNAKNIGGNGPNSATWNFTTVINSPAAPVLVAPPNGSVNVTLMPLLDWNDVPTATAYRVMVSVDSLFTTYVINDTNITISQYQVLTAVLQNNTKYFWKVSARNAGGGGPWCSSWNFRTIVPIPPVPVLIAPPNNSTNQPLNVLFDWDSIAVAETYRIQLSTDSAFAITLWDTVVVQSNLRAKPGLLSLNVKYFWRVNATNIAGTGNWSAGWNFRTTTVGIKLYSSEIPTEFKLHNNFPNPFNPSTKIRFDISKKSNTKISIYDISGRLIKDELNTILEPGKYEIDFRADNLASGIYFYILETQYFRDVKRMVLIK